MYQTVCKSLIIFIFSLTAYAREAEIQKPTTATTSTHKTEGSVSPQQAMKFLENGNNRFVKGHLRKDGATAKDRKNLANGQKPHTIVLSCSDSRVPPELVFDQKLGEIFVVRTAGESLDASAIGSMEYAVEHLGAKLILVMGHESCGAVKAALGTKPGESAGSPSLDHIVSDIRPRISSARQPASPNVMTESILNAKGVAADLLKRSEIIKKAVEAGDAEIHSSIYHLETGVVNFF